MYNSHGWSFLRDTARWKKTIYAKVEIIFSKITDVIINVSKYEYNSAIRFGIKEQNMKLIYSGSKMPTKSVEKSLFPTDGAINILFVGRFDRPKGLDILLEAIKRYNNYNIHLYVAGAAVISDYIVDNYSEYDITNITFLGWIPHEKIYEYYLSCDVVIMPSRWEAFGLVAIEAMKYKKPVIVSNRGALPELVEDGVNGYIFDLDNINSLYDILGKLKKENLKKMGENAYNVFLDKFTSEKMREAIKKVYLDSLFLPR